MKRCFSRAGVALPVQRSIPNGGPCLASEQVEMSDRSQQTDEKPWGKCSLFFISEKVQQLLCRWLQGSVRPHFLGLLGQGTEIVGCESPRGSGDACGAELAGGAAASRPGEVQPGLALPGAVPLPCWRSTLSFCKLALGDQKMGVQIPAAFGLVSWVGGNLATNTRVPWSPICTYLS